MMKDLGAVLIYSCQGARFAPLSKFTHCGGNGLRVPPVPIPNTEVKPQHADGTWLETARESRTSPDSRKGSGEERKFFPVTDIPQ